jgi:CO/xanthine dehydrogenase Mo-binding subunit
MQMGNAVKSACEKLTLELIGIASKTRGGNPEEWRFIDGHLCWGGDSYSLGEIVGRLGDGSSVRAIGYHHPSPTQKDSAFAGIDHWAPSAAAAEVEIDCDTGEFQVVQFSVIADAGYVLHHGSAKAQVEGGVVMGFGHALFEEMVYQEGQLQNGDPFQYRLPTMRDIPDRLYSFMMQKRDGPGPFGSKGMSQTSIVTVAPAIGNAIYDAIGVRIRSLPITPEKILRALGKVP